MNKTTMTETDAFFKAVSLLMPTFDPNQHEAKVALLRHAEQALCPRVCHQALKIQGGPKWPERAKLGQDLPLYFRGDEERRQDKRSKSGV